MSKQEELNQSFLKAVIYSELLSQELENLKDTNMYKQSFKNKLNQVQKECERFAEAPLNHLYKEDEELLTNSLQKLELFVGMLSKTHLRDMIVFIEILKKFDERKEELVSNFEIEMNVIK